MNTSRIKHNVNSELKYTNISNMLLVPGNYDLKQHEDLIQVIVNQHPIFRELCLLEKEIEPLIESMEERGLLISSQWLTKGLINKKIKLNHAILELNNLIGLDNDIFSRDAVKEYWLKNHMRVVYSDEQLRNYKNLDPTYELVQEISKHKRYLKTWEVGINKWGVITGNSTLIKGKWTSFSSYTGRMTAKRLPLTSIPTKMRDYIVHPKGMRIISLDLNAAELRFVAYFSKSKRMLDLFSNGLDPHSETANVISKVLSSNNPDDDLYRELAKRFNFSMLYGASDRTIAKNLSSVNSEVTSAKVSEIRMMINQMYPEINEFLRKMESSEKLHTPLGKIQPIEHFEMNQKRNFLFQSSVAVTIKKLMLITSQYFEIAHVLHDEIWFYAPISGPTESVLNDIKKQFYKETDDMYQGFPIHNLITMNIIGGEE